MDLGRLSEYTLQDTRYLFLPAHSITRGHIQAILQQFFR